MYDMNVDTNSQMYYYAQKDAKKEIRRCSNKNSFTLLMFYILVNAVVLLTSYLIKHFVKPENLSPIFKHLFNNYYGFVVQFVIIVPIILLFFNIKGKITRTYLKKSHVGAKFIFKWILITMSISYLVNIIFTIIFMIIQMFGAELHAPTFVVPNPSWYDFLLQALLVGIIGPIAEEFMFRGSFLANLSKFGEWFAVIMIAVFFGLYHTNYQQIFFATVMGIIAGFLTIKTKSIYPAIFSHIFMNFFAVIQSFFVGDIDLQKLEQLKTPREIILFFKDNFLSMTGLMFMSMISIIIFILGLVLFIIEITKNRKFFRLENNFTILTTSEKISTYLTAPVTIILLLFFAVFTAIRMLGLW